MGAGMPTNIDQPEWGSPCVEHEGRIFVLQPDGRWRDKDWNDATIEWRDGRYVVTAVHLYS